jgi:benzoate membrane transport protein
MATIGNALASAVHKESDREAAMVTFLISLSGVVIGGVGSAFWGLLAGSLALAVQHYRPLKA